MHDWWQVLVDVNWRPVFFDDEAKAKETITPYVLEADLLKVRLVCRCIGRLHACKRALAATAAIVPSCASSVAQVTEDEAEWLFGIPGDVALSMPERVRPTTPQPTCTCQPALLASSVLDSGGGRSIHNAYAAGAGVLAEGQGGAGDGGRRGQLVRLQGRRRQGGPARAGARAEGAAAACPWRACSHHHLWFAPRPSVAATDSLMCAVLQVDVMDTTGAGDGFLGGFLHHTVKKGAPPPSAAACLL